MSIISTWLRRLLGTRITARPSATNPDAMSLREWADLPPHHPSCDRAPC
jgi:hypothetical protein